MADEITGEDITVLRNWARAFAGLGNLEPVLRKAMNAKDELAAFDKAKTAGQADFDKWQGDMAKKRDAESKRVSKAIADADKAEADTEADRQKLVASIAPLQKQVADLQDKIGALTQQAISTQNEFDEKTKAKQREYDDAVKKYEAFKKSIGAGS